jgi:hypothetical protein
MRPGSEVPDGAGGFVDEQLVDAEIATEQVLDQAHQRDQRCRRAQAERRGGLTRSTRTPEQPQAGGEQEKAQGRIGLHRHEPGDPALEDRDVKDPPGQHQARDYANDRGREARDAHRGARPVGHAVARQGTQSLVR